MVPREVRQGETISAEAYNALVRSIRRMGLSQGLAFGMPDAGIVGLLPALMPDDAKWARITAYTGPAPDATGGVACELITYNVAFLRGTQDVMTNRRPDLGHPFPDGVKVRPAAVGDPAVILSWHTAGDAQRLLYVPCGQRGERVIVAECAAARGDGGGA